MNRWFSRKVPARQWLMVLLTAVVCLAGWQVWLTARLLEQDRNLEQQNAREHLGQVADLTVAQLSGRLGDWELGLRELSGMPPSASLTARFPRQATWILVRAEKVEVFPPRTLLFVPVVPKHTVDLPPEFDAAEDLELRQQQYERAIVLLHGLAEKKAARPEAILRIARIENKRGQSEAALAAYKALERETAANAEGIPYSLVAVTAQCRILAQMGRQRELSEQAAQLRTGLLQGRWELSREVFEYRWSELETLGLQHADPPRSLVEFATVIHDLYSRWQATHLESPNTSGRDLQGDGTILVWSSSSDHVSAMLSPPDWLSSSLALPRDSGQVQWRLLAPGTSASSSALVVTRSLADARLPGRLEFTSRQSFSQTASRRRTLLLAGATMMLIVILGSGYVVQRAISRELRVAQLQSDFVNAVSHEFRSPLTTLRSTTELLAQNRVSESRRQRSYEFLERETARLHRMVEDLLDFGRMESGRKQYRMAPHDAFELVRGTLTEFSAHAAANGFRVESEFPSGNGHGPVRILADEEALRRALRNLLDNAVKYSPECRTIWVNGSVEGSTVCIAVRDRGMGIDPEERQAIFEKFRRGDAAKEAGIKGTGIGLAMVRQIVEAMHGEIQLKSEVGVGSTFTVVLPLAKN